MYGIETWQKISTPSVKVEAVRLTEDNVQDIAVWCGGDLVQEIDPEYPEEHRDGINVPTGSGNVRASLGMYVAKYGWQFFVAHNRVFETSWEPQDRPATPLESIGDSVKARGFADPFGRGA